MKILAYRTRVIAAMVFPALVAGCSQMSAGSREPMSREKVVENLSPIVDLERRGNQLTMVMQELPHVARLSAEDVRALKEHYDIYYVYHAAAATSLAEGDLRAYRDHVRVGSQELDSLEAKLKDVVKKSSGEPPPRPFVPGSAFRVPQ